MGETEERRAVVYIRNNRAVEGEEMSSEWHFERSTAPDACQVAA